MKNRLFGVGLPLLAVGLLFAAGDLRAQEGKPPEAKPAETAAELTKRDQTVHDFLYEVIEKGRVLYNKNRDYFGCCRVYHNALVGVLPLLDHRSDLQKTTVEGLKKSEQVSVLWERALALRKLIDRVRSTTTASAPSKSDPEEKKVDKGKKPEDPDKEGDDKKPGGAEKDKLEKKGKSPAPEGATVTGTVTYKGKPLSSGFVTLVSKDGKKYSASIKADGTYAFRKIAPPAGPYRVAIENSVTLAKGQPAPVAIPQRFRSPDTSGLTATLNRGENEFDIDLLD